MAEIKVDKNLFLNASKTYTDEEGNEVFGVWEWGHRDPETHRIVFDDAERVEGDQPPQAPQAVEEPDRVTVEKTGSAAEIREQGDA